jgi:hypothetical protein
MHDNFSKNSVRDPTNAVRFNDKVNAQVSNVEKYALPIETFDDPVLSFRMKMKPQSGEQTRLLVLYPQSSTRCSI